MLEDAGSFHLHLPANAMTRAQSERTADADFTETQVQQAQYVIDSLKHASRGFVFPMDVYDIRVISVISPSRCHADVLMKPCAPPCPEHEVAA